MVSLLRKPLGFAFIYALLAALISYLTATMPVGEYALLAINYGALVLFTMVYVFLVAAHLSNHFRLYAAIYIPLLGLLLGLVFLGIANPMMLVGMLKDIHTWINLAIAFVVSYVLITIGNWLAGYMIKTKGHI